MNFSEYNDLQLNDLLNEVVNEQERRRDISWIPEKINELRSKFVSSGGDPSELDIPVALPEEG